MTDTNTLIKRWFQDNPDIKQIIVGIFDYNGVLRAKRVPVNKLDGLLSSGMKMPLSIQVLDIFGEDIADSDLVFASGDQDSTAHPTGRLPIRLSHLGEPTALLIMSFQSDTPQDAIISPHEMLGNLAEKQALQNEPLLLCGVEMEFTLLRPDQPRPALSLATNEPAAGGQILSALHLDDYDGLFSAISAFCGSQSIAIDTITSEAGEGQFEVTFQPKTDLCELAEDVLIFKYIVKSLAKSFGIKASFMAKPIEGQPGNGMHVHASLIDRENGRNLFDEAEYGNAGTTRLQQAISGLLSSMKDASLFLAPMMNSYRRLVASSHAPVNICWGEDNRTAAIRVPASAPQARRLEMRVAGADANPYFLLAWLSGAMHHGMSDQMAPVPPVVGNAYEQSFEQLASTMAEALALAGASALLSSLIGADILRYYLATKTQDYDRFSAHIPPLEFSILSEQL